MSNFEIKLLTKFPNKFELFISYRFSLNINKNKIINKHFTDKILAIIFNIFALLFLMFIIIYYIFYVYFYI